MRSEGRPPIRRRRACGATMNENGALVKDEPVVVHCYTTRTDIEDSRNLAELGSFCRTMGRDARQGEVGLVIGDEYFAIRVFTEE